MYTATLSAVRWLGLDVDIPAIKTFVTTVILLEYGLKGADCSELIRTTSRTEIGNSASYSANWGTYPFAATLF